MLFNSLTVELFLDFLDLLISHSDIISFFPKHTWWCLIMLEANLNCFHSNTFLMHHIHYLHTQIAITLCLTFSAMVKAVNYSSLLNVACFIRLGYYRIQIQFELHRIMVSHPPIVKKTLVRFLIYYIFCMLNIFWPTHQHTHIFSEVH